MVHLLSNRESPCKLGTELVGTSPRARLELRLGNSDDLAAFLTSVEDKIQYNVR